MKSSRTAIAVLLMMAAPLGLSAQQASPTAGLDLPADHWARDILWRAGALSGSGVGDVPARELTLRSTLRALHHVAQDTTLPEHVRDLAHRAAEDMGWEYPAWSWGREVRVGGHLGFEAHARSGGAEVGQFSADSIWHNRTWEAAQPLAPDAGVIPFATAYASVGRVGGEIEAVLAPESSQIERAYLAYEGERYALWGGRRTIGAEPTMGGAITLARRIPITGFGGSVEPFRLPWVLSRLGPVEGSFSLGQTADNGGIVRPWLATMRATLHPTRDMDLILNRAALLGGENNTPVTPRLLLGVAIGEHGGESTEFENQIVSLGTRYRPRFLPLPAELYLEWGFEDSAGAWWNVPGIQAGVFFPSLPGLPNWDLLVERTHFATQCCGNPPWYRHRVFRDGWSFDEAPAGHALGGDGTEWRVRSSGTHPAHPARLRTEVFHRVRGPENLYAPLLQGQSLGASLLLDATWGEHLGVRLQAGVERGGTWLDRSASLMLMWSP